MRALERVYMRYYSQAVLACSESMSGDGGE